jgi:hypothetical protein
MVSSGLNEMRSSVSEMEYLIDFLLDICGLPTMEMSSCHGNIKRQKEEFSSERTRRGSTEIKGRDTTAIMPVLLFAYERNLISA